MGFTANSPPPRLLLLLLLLLTGLRFPHPTSPHPDAAPHRIHCDVFIWACVDVDVMCGVGGVVETTSVTVRMYRVHCNGDA
ncbi:unnamed protein product [Hydatigera taeniaeformis]|uniref:Secreted protein n=1 Tax=Hydatigena taeniaeformis TaxID=6205 RepID=A0A0R3WKZ1_HYDTA|nr:unnamed protein product [Hydatigera taeniaeformis]